MKLIYPRQYFSYSVDQKLKMSEIPVAIVLVHSTSSITSGVKVCRELKMVAILEILKYWTQLQYDLRYENIVPNYAKKYFHDADVIDDVTGCSQSWPSIFLYKLNNIFHDNLKKSKDVIIKLSVHRYHELMTTII